MSMIGATFLTSVAAWAAGPVPTPSPTEGVTNDQLKSAVANAEKKLGPLEAWQKKIFDQEVVPRYQRFIKGYQAGTSGLNVEVDLEGIKTYVRFYAPSSIKKTDIKALLYVKSDSTCPKCAEAASAIRADIKQRLENRGFNVIPIPLEDKANKLIGKALDDKMNEQFQRLNATVAVVVQSQIAPNDDIDSAHADETRYLIRSYLLLRDSPKIEAKLEILDTDSISGAADRLMTDALVEIGGRSTEIAATFSDDRSEVDIGIRGILEPAELARVKTLLQSKLKDIGVVEERKLARGNVIFAVLTTKKANDIKARLSGMGLEMEIQ